MSCMCVRHLRYCEYVEMRGQLSEVGFPNMEAKLRSSGLPHTDSTWRAISEPNYCFGLFLIKWVIYLGTLRSFPPSQKNKKL